MPLLTALVHLVVSGQEMGERHAREVAAAQLVRDAHIRHVAGRTTPTDRVAAARGLLGAGGISRPACEGITSRALG